MAFRPIARTALALALAALVLAACSSGGGNGASEPTPELQYRGEWVWVLEFASSGIRFEGLQSISDPIEDSESGALTDAEGGIWRWCVLGFDNCDTPSGLGLMATYEGSDLILSFADEAAFIKALIVDEDGELEFNDEGDPIFAGLGEWYFDSGESARVGLAMIRASETPEFELEGASVASGRRVPSEVRADLERALDALPAAEVTTSVRANEARDALDVQRIARQLLRP